MSKVNQGKKRLTSGRQILLSVVVFIIANLLAMASTQPLFQMLFCLLAFVFVWYGFKMIFQKGEKDVFLSDVDCFSISKKTGSKLGLGLLLGIVLFSISVLILVVSHQYKLSFNGLNSLSLLQGLFLFIVVGTYEELFTRGIIQHLLSKRFNKWVALWGTSVIFSSLHLLNYSFTVFSFIGILAAGMALGMTMYITNSITAAIGFHISWNWIQGYFYGISVSGTGLGKNMAVLNTQVIGTSDILTGGKFGAEASIVTSMVLFLFSFICYLCGKKDSALKK